jgi:methionine-S-sulfoxide reductase
MMRNWIVLLSTLTLVAGVGCQSPRSGEEGSEAPSAETSAPEQENSTPSEGSASSRNRESASKIEALGDPPKGLEQATFAGGCFWCLEPPFDKVDGVEKTIVGYSGGERRHPTYDEVAGGETDHAESIRIYYDPETVSYEKLLDVFWRHIDPTDDGGQFVDRGSQYRTIVFYHDAEQKKAARASKRDLEKNGPFDEPIVTPIQKAQTFWKAEDYHQNFYKKSPGRYHSYHGNSGRKEFFRKYWGDE